MFFYGVTEKSDQKKERKYTVDRVKKYWKSENTEKVMKLFYEVHNWPTSEHFFITRYSIVFADRTDSSHACNFMLKRKNVLIIGIIT